MLNNYLKIALRNLLKNRRFTVINILGLAIGIACCILILLYVADERSYDRHWPAADRVYRMSLTRIYPDRRTGYAIVPPSYAQSVKTECPEVAEAVRIVQFNPGTATVFKVGDRIREEKEVLAADSTFFRVFQVPLLYGNPDKALTDPNALVLSASAALRFFGTTNAVGQSVQLPGVDAVRNLNVAAVCADLPENTHFRFDVLLTTKGARFLEETNHISFAANTYFLLHPGADARQLEARFPGIVEKYAAGEIQRNFGVGWDEYKKLGNGYHYFLTPLRDIHLYSHLDNELRPPGDAATVRIFGLIAGFILLIACVNFMNLATARGAQRAREVGVRKSLGGERRQIVGQFLLEAGLIGLLSGVVAAGLASLALPAFNALAGKTLHLGDFNAWLGIPGLLLFALAAGLLAGSYPAGVLSRFSPMEALKGRHSTPRGGVALRNGLVVFQFAVSIAMLVSTLVVFRQLRYISQKQLGFQKEHVLTLPNAGFLGTKTESFKQELMRLPGALAVGGASEMPGGTNYFGMSFKKPADREPVTGRCAIVDDRFFQTLGVALTAGRGFSTDHDDSLSVVLNERAARDLGLGPDPLGQRLVMPGSFFDPNNGEVTFTVVGIVRDFHFQSLHENIVPLYFVYNRVSQGRDNVLAVRVQPDHFQDFIAAAQQRWQAFVPDQPFHYNFLDAELAALYAAEQRTQGIFTVFALLAVFIACMGLLGLSTHLIQQRTKEIGIRKVLGASVAGLTGMLARDFLKLVLLSILIASPAAWYFMDRWLADFAYRIDLAWWMFAAAGLTAVAVAFFTVGVQSVKAALANPVRALRNE